MADVYVSTNWYPAAGREDEFVRTWHDALSWSRQEFGDDLEHARLLRDEEDRTHFVSFIEWADGGARDRWFDHPGFAERLAILDGMCRQPGNGSTYEEATRVA